MACEPEDVISVAEALCCIPPALQAPIQNYLLARIRGGSMDVDEIVRDAACQFACISPGLLPRIRTYLLCQLSNTGGGTIPEPECDADALEFIAAAGITVEAQRNAICRLVASLKSQGTPPFWDSEILIYPFVGGTGPQHSYNLKDPTTYQLTYAGAAVPVHSALGMAGTGNGYAITQYIPRIGPPALNIHPCRTYTYIDNHVATSSEYFFGAFSDANVNRLNLYRASILNLGSAINATSAWTFASTANGGWLSQRPNATQGERAYNGGALTTVALNATNTPNAILPLLCANNGVPPGITPSAYSNSRISGLSLGNRNLTAAEWPIYHSIWQTFQTELGRQRP